VPAHTLTRGIDADDLTWVGGPVTAQQARVLAVLASAAPDPVDVDTLASRLGVQRGRLLVTLRSLQRERLVVAVRGRGSGWALAEAPTRAP
jgi:DNA-binding IscR family transcriptional regulator